MASSEETYEKALPNGVSINPISLTGGTTEISFSPNSFRPSVSGSIQITNNANTYKVEINSEGLINYYSL